MSSPFKYEIDERRLRLRLKENEVPFHEDAWLKFEAFAATQNQPVNDTLVQRFQFSLNRNLVLPLVFASVIVLFSLLLFNFITIKNPNAAADRGAQASAAPQEPGTSPTTEAQVLPSRTMQQRDTLPASNSTQPQAQPEGAGKASPLSSQKPEVLVENSGTARLPLAEPTQPAQETLSVESAPVSASDYTPVLRKKRRKLQPVVTEPAQEEIDQTPPPPETAE